MVEQEKIAQTENNAGMTKPAEPTHATANDEHFINQQNEGKLAKSDNNMKNAVNDANYMHRNIGGRFNQYTSSFWAIAIPALMARYVARFSIKLLNLREVVEKLAPNNNIVKSISNMLYPIVAGSWMMGIITHYKNSTFKDVKNVFAESVAFDLGKAPQDVTEKDIRSSNNAIVKSTLEKIHERNVFRYAIAALFFIPWAPIYNKILKPLTKKEFIDSDADPVDLAVGATGLYLVSDVLKRKEALFEKWQKFIDVKINHNGEVAEKVTANDLLNIYDIHIRTKDKHYIAPNYNSEHWQENVAQAERMAKLMNQTYNNETIIEHAKFTVPKLIYLWGGGSDGVPILNGNFAQNMAFIELANKSENMQEVKEVAKAIRSGFPAEEAFAHYGIEVKSSEVKENNIDKEHKTNVEKFAANRSAPIKPAKPPENYTDKLLLNSSSQQTAPSFS